MKAFARISEHPLLPICIVIGLAFFSAGCSSSRVNSGATTNPLGAYTQDTSSTNTSNTVIGDGNTIVPGSSNTPIISVTEDGSNSIDGHDNAPLLDNKHPGWQQSDCLTCHNDTTNNPDHNYTDDTLCYLCHGTNGLPGMADTTPPVLTSVVVSPTDSSVTVSWKSDEDCVSRLILKTSAGDKMEFPVSSNYTTSHKKTISGLQSSTTYFYELVCTDKSGNKTTSSSFSSNLTFTTLEKVVTPTVSTETEQEETTENLDETGGYFTSVKVNSPGNNAVNIDFITKSTPEARQLYWYIFPSRAEARKKAEGQRVASDNLSPRSDNTYSTQTDTINGVDKKKEYYLRIGVNFSDGSKWSDIYPFKFNN